MVATALTRAAAVFGSSAAADIPTGKPRDAPSPQNTTPTIEIQSVGTKITMIRPMAASTAEPRNTGTRP